MDIVENYLNRFPYCSKCKHCHTNSAGMRAGGTLCSVPPAHIGQGIFARYELNQAKIPCPIWAGGTLCSVPPAHIGQGIFAFANNLIVKWFFLEQISQFFGIISYFKHLFFEVLFHTVKLYISRGGSRYGQIQSEHSWCMTKWSKMCCQVSIPLWVTLWNVTVGPNMAHIQKFYSYASCLMRAPQNVNIQLDWDFVWLSSIIEPAHRTISVSITTCNKETKSSV